MRMRINDFFTSSNLNVKRMFLCLLIVLQAGILIGHLMYQRSYIENNAEKILRNTSLLKTESFETSLDAMRYQMRVIGNAILLNHTVTIDDADAFLIEELKRPWLDGVIVFNEHGDFVSTQALFPLENALDATTHSLASFRQSILFKNLRRNETTEHLFYWQSKGADPNLTGFVLYRAVRDPQGRYLGGIVGILNSHSLDEMFRTMEREGFELGPEGAMAVFDRDNAVQLARMGANTVKEAPHSNPQLTYLLEFANDSALVHHYTSPVDGIPRIGVFINLNDRKWVLAVGLSESDIFHGWYFQALWTVIAIIVISITQWLLLHYIHTNALQRQRLDREARYDLLTGLANRRYFFEWARDTCNIAKRHRRPLWLLSMDLDFFKKINDVYGHDGGDAVLKVVGDIIPVMIRSSDLAVRFGGEEFIVAMPDAIQESACEIAERIRTRFESEKVLFNGQAIKFTVSIGITQMTQAELDMENGMQMTLARADKALYDAKRKGRNCYMLANDL
ncbi:MAG: sensor domain-containing diguanylate cyclase [Silvania sp.]|uniref:sensor domain-containing diguanylate cyclase n=1 Tax=Silvania sp. TaxID=3016633 RepID=UPI003EE66A60